MKRISYIGLMAFLLIVMSAQVFAELRFESLSITAVKTNQVESGLESKPSPYTLNFSVQPGDILRINSVAINANEYDLIQVSVDSLLNSDNNILNTSQSEIVTLSPNAKRNFEIDISIPTGTSAGIYDLNIAVRGKRNNSNQFEQDIQWFKLQIVPVQARPTIQAVSNIQVNEGEPVSITMRSTLADNGQNVFSSNFSKLIRVSQDATSARFQWTPTFDEAGVYAVRFSVRDNDNVLSETTEPL